VGPLKRAIFHFIRRVGILAGIHFIRRVGILAGIGVCAARSGDIYAVKTLLDQLAQ
jgi:hypothetical protein